MIVVRLLLGIVAALAVTRLMVGILFGVTPSDPASFAAVGFVLMAVALVAFHEKGGRSQSPEPKVCL